MKSNRSRGLLVSPTVTNEVLKGPPELNAILSDFTMINMSRQVGHAGQPMNGSHGEYGSASDSEERVSRWQTRTDDRKSEMSVLESDRWQDLHMAIYRAVTWIEDQDCTGNVLEGLRLIRLLEMRAVKLHEVAGRTHVHRLSMIIP